MWPYHNVAMRHQQDLGVELLLVQGISSNHGIDDVIVVLNTTAVVWLFPIVAVSVFPASDLQSASGDVAWSSPQIHFGLELETDY